MENNDNPNTQIFIAKIHPRVSEKELKYKFKKYGDIVDIRLKTGYAFIVINIIFKDFLKRILQTRNKPRKQLKKWTEKRSKANQL